MAWCLGKGKSLHLLLLRHLTKCRLEFDVEEASYVFYVKRAKMKIILLILRKRVFFQELDVEKASYLFYVKTTKMNIIVLILRKCDFAQVFGALQHVFSKEFYSLRKYN